jgi:hypothetical protein
VDLGGVVPSNFGRKNIKELRDFRCSLRRIKIELSKNQWGTRRRSLRKSSI